jgi:pyruvate ferredoxin oxidoreductase beta subunit
MKRTGKLPQDKNTKFIAAGGDGGTYDIGLQSLSGAMERGHDMVYVCYDNGAYMNTGIQRSSATPQNSWTTTSEVGTEQAGKIGKRKDLTAIMAAHHIPYVGQAAVGYWKDLITKAEKAFVTDGFAFLNILAPCPRGWRHGADQTLIVGRSAVETGFWPLFEVEEGQWRMTMPARTRQGLKPVSEFLSMQGRFKHLFKPGNEHLLKQAQQDVDEYYAYLLNRAS